MKYFRICMILICDVQVMNFLLNLLIYEQILVAKLDVFSALYSSASPAGRGVFFL